MKEYYTYAYVREDGTPYYIGKGRGRRAYTNDNRSCPRPDRDRIKILKENLTEEEAFLHEREMIQHYGRKDIGTGILRNLTEGGEGFSSEAMKEFWRQRREKELDRWRERYDKGAEWREANYDLMNHLVTNLTRTWLNRYNGL